MPDSAPHAQDTVRAELLRAAAGTLARSAPALPPEAASFMAQLYAGVPSAELAEATPEAMAAATAGLWSLASQRRPNEALVRVTRPGSSAGPRAVAEIVTDDMPFLVDSALAALTKGGRVVRQLLHPVTPIQRDAQGRLLGWGDGSGDAKRESWMRIEFTGSARRQGSDDGPALEAALRSVMDDVRAATTDYDAMLALLRCAEQEVAANNSAPDTGPAQAFLRWMADDNFVLLGHRRIAVGAQGALSAAAGEDLGLLRRPGVAVFDALADLAAVPQAVRAALLEPAALAVAKANLRSTVHRAQHGDVVVTRIFGRDGAVAGVRVFYGLFAATAYNRNPRSIPLLAQKVDAILAASGVDPESHDGRALRNTLDTWPRDELFQAPEAAILEGARRALDLRLRPRAALALRLDPFERFVSAIVWLPRDVFDTQLRERVGGMLARAFAGRIAAFYIALGDEPLARVNYIVSTTPGAVPHVDMPLLEAAIRQAARDFRDRLGEVLVDAEGEAAAAELIARWGDAFPAAYRERATPARRRRRPTDDVAGPARRAAAVGRRAAAARKPGPPGHAGGAVRPGPCRRSPGRIAGVRAAGRGGRGPGRVPCPAGRAGRLAGRPGRG